MNSSLVHAPSAARTRQSGSALIIALILLLVITILAVAGMQNTVLQERMAGNMHDRNIAFQNAERGLRDAANDPNIANDANAPVSFSPTNAEEWDKHPALRDTPPNEFAHFVERLEVREPCDPEEVCPPLRERPIVPVYRVTSKGVGGTEHAVVILQAIVRPN
nr:PilX N-terminal domain-containing pilus assembly protein [Thioalkalivibrio sp. ALJT]